MRTREDNVILRKEILQYWLLQPWRVYLEGNNVKRILLTVDGLDKRLVVNSNKDPFITNIKKERKRFTHLPGFPKIDSPDVIRLAESRATRSVDLAHFPLLFYTPKNTETILNSMGSKAPFNITVLINMYPFSLRRAKLTLVLLGNLPFPNDAVNFCATLTPPNQLINKVQDHTVYSPVRLRHQLLRKSHQRCAVSSTAILVIIIILRLLALLSLLFQFHYTQNRLNISLLQALFPSGYVCQ